MADVNSNPQIAHELGKLYHSFLDKKLLCDFFIENTARLVHAERGLLFMAGAQNKVWLESASDPSYAPSDSLKSEVQDTFEKGKPVTTGQALLIPLIDGNFPVGIACFLKETEQPPFSDDEFALASNLGYQLAGALKTLLLYEQNLKMERLAAIGQTVGVVLHEVKNIIQLATFSQEYLRMGMEKKKDEFLNRGIKGVEKAIRDMDGFVYEMLSLTKDYKICPEMFSLQTLLQELVDDLKEKAKQFGVRLECAVGTDFPEVEGEPRSLYRSLLNLVKNALEASDPNKKEPFVRIEAGLKNADSYEIVISDNGTGMSDETKAKLFQAFFSTKGEKGTGLGLLVIDRTVCAHHGDLKVDSRLGEGTVFTLTLPKKIPV